MDCYQFKYDGSFLGCINIYTGFERTLRWGLADAIDELVSIQKYDQVKGSCRKPERYRIVMPSSKELTLDEAKRIHDTNEKSDFAHVNRPGKIHVICYNLVPQWFNSNDVFITSIGISSKYLLLSDALVDLEKSFEKELPDYRIRELFTIEVEGVYLKIDEAKKAIEELNSWVGLNKERSRKD